MANGLPPEFYARLRKALQESGQFDTDDIARTAFIDARIYLWRNEIPTTGKNIEQRVKIVIDWLLYRYNSARENALILLLRVLSDNYDKDDARHTNLARLANELDCMLSDTMRFTANSIFFLIYDWEDRPEVKQLVKNLRERGLRISWDQDWDFWKDRTEELRQKINQADAILLYSTPTSRDSEWVTEDLIIVSEEGNGKIIVDLDSAESYEETGNMLIKKLDITGLKTQSRYIRKTSAYTVDQYPEEVEEKLREALKSNLNIPYDIIADKIFVSPKTCALIEEAYDIASRRIPPDRTERLQASLQYARLLRFQGEWDKAEKILTLGKGNARKTDLYSVFCLELGALRFELGLKTEIELVQQALNEMKGRDFVPELTKILRQLGNMHREQGDWTEAADYLSRASSMARFLKEFVEKKFVEPQDIYTSISYESCYLLWVDCMREYASLLFQQGHTAEATAQFENALKHTQSEAISKHAEHLRGIILYQLGRVYLIHQKDVKKALEYFRQSVQILRKYDNPVRLAFLCDAIGKAMIQQRPLPDLESAQRHLNRAKKIRDNCGHTYFSTYTMLGLADLYQLQDNFTQAIEQLEEVRDTLFELGKMQDAGLAYFKLGECYYKAGLKREAIASLEQAKELFIQLELNDRLREVEYTTLKIKFGAGLEDISLERLKEYEKSENYTFHLREIGEYRFHTWLKRRFEQWRRRDIPKISGLDKSVWDLIEVGIGDDASVINIPNSDAYDLVINTDAAPGSICRSLDIEMGKYAAKFSVVHSLSDILAMGGTPIAILLNMYLTHNVTLEYAMTIPLAVAQEAERYNIALIGGDMKERAEQSIGCIAIGIVKKGKAIQRRTAKAGQVLAITQAGMRDGPGLRRIGCRWAQDIIEYRKLEKEMPYSSFYLEKNWKKELLFLPWKEMIAGAKTGLIKSAIDTSDGFLSCLQLIGRASRVSFVLEEKLIEEIIDDKVKEIAEAMGFRPSQFLFNAGHDWEIVLTVEENDFAALQQAMRKVDGDLVRLGKAVAQEDQLKDSIALISSDDGEAYRIPFFTDEKFVRHPYQERPLDWEDLKFYLEGRHKLDLIHY